MLRSINDLSGLTIRATDGEIGSVDTFFFDDVHWSIRYIVVKTGGWLLPETVLISPQSIGAVNWEQRLITVHMNRDQVQVAPQPTTDQPISRQIELAHASYYGYELYWYWSRLWSSMGMPFYSIGMADNVPISAGAGERKRVRVVERDLPQGDTHLRSTHDMAGYHIRASDGAIGHVKDLVMDDATWVLRYLVADTQNWWAGWQVLLAPSWITAVNWDDRMVDVDVPRATIKAGPEYDPTQLNRDYEQQLYDHYKQPYYWEEAPIKH